MDYGNKFNLFDNEDEIIKLLDDAAARTGCRQPTRTSLWPSTIIHWHSSPAFWI